MPDIGNPLVCELTGYDHRGVLVGSASWPTEAGNWCVLIVGDPTIYIAWSQPYAEQMLRRAGATRIEEGDGKR